MHIVFSMRDSKYAESKAIKESAMKAINEMYPNNCYAVAIHNDTDNPHCHLVLKMRDIYGKRINPQKADLQTMREKFAENLRKLGIEATATKKERSAQRNFIYRADQNAHKAHHYEVLDFGEARYKLDDNAKMSYFVKYRTNGGKEIEIWADNLVRVIKENSIKRGEYCRFVITSQEPKKIKIQDSKFSLN